MRSLIAIAALLLQSLSFSPVVYAQSSANTGAPVSCPFTTSSTTDSISQVRASLRALSGSSDVCNQMISQNAMSLDTLLNSILEERLPTHRINIDGTTQLTCQNFETVLAREKQLALDSKDNQYFTIGASFLPRYRECEPFKDPLAVLDPADLAPEYIGITQSQRFDLCVEKVHQENYYLKVEECEIRNELDRENRRNEAYRARISEITQVATNLIASSQNCSDSDILRNITQSIIPLITTLGTFAFANPLVGVGMALGGNLASALVDRFFNTQGPNEYIALLEAEEQATNLNCLYYQVQNDVLSCGRPSPFQEESVPQIVSCYNERQDRFLENIYELSSAVRRALGSNDPLIQADIADSIREKLGAMIELPDGRSLRAIDYLEQAAQSLRSDPSRSADVMTARRIDKVIEAYNAWESAANGEEITPESEAAILSSNTQLINAVKGESGQQPLDVIDTMRRYWTRDQRESSQTMIGRLRAMESPDLYFSHIPQQSNDVRTSRSTRIAHDALIHLYQARFQNRLTEQHEAYLRNRKPQGDTLYQENLDYIIPLFQNCTLNAGMYHYQRRNGNHHSVNRVGEPSDAYKNVCSMFNCEGNNLLPQFNPSTNDPDSVASQFRNYQCALKAQYNQQLNRMVNSYRQHGQICPPPPRPENVGGQYSPQTPEGQSAHLAHSPSIPDEDSNQGGGGFFGWLGNLFKGIGDFFKNLFGGGKSS